MMAGGSAILLKLLPIIHIVLKADLLGHTVITGGEVATPFMHLRQEVIQITVDGFFAFGEHPLIDPPHDDELGVLLADGNHIAPCRNFG